jgi:hypothetical protein
MNMMPLTIAADVPIWLGFTTSAAGMPNVGRAHQ